MGNKKTNTKKKSRTSACAAKAADPTEPTRPTGPAASTGPTGPAEEDEAILTQEEFMERIRNIRRARAAAAGVEYQPPPKRKGPVKPFIPPFNPNLPPAAFPSLPTIGQPIPTGTREGHLRRVKEDRERRLQVLEPLPRGSYHPGPIFRISGQNEAADTNEPANKESSNNEDPEDADGFDAQYEASDGVNVDWEASNTALNPVYMGNMAKMAGDGQKESIGANEVDLANQTDMDFSDSDVETEQMAPVPQWKKLTRSLQAEIIDNLMEQHNWDDTMDMLGLTRKQEMEAKKHLRQYQKAVDHEVKELKKMRDRQHRVLLGLDNSIDHNVPVDQTLGRIMNESLENIMRDPNRKFLKCKRSELRAAWLFLEERGLPLELAGDEGNGTETIRPEEDEERVAKSTKRSHPRATNERPSVMPMSADPTKELSLADKTAVIGDVQGGALVLPADTEHPTQTLQKHWDDWDQLFTEPDENQAHLARERRLQLALGKDGTAAVVADQDGPAQPEPRVTQYRYNQRIEQAKLDAEAEKQAAEANNGLPFTTRDIAEGTWEQKLEARYEKLANDCQKLFLSYDSRDDVEYEDNSDLDEKELEELLAEAEQSNKNLRCLLKDGSNSQSADPDVNME